MVTNTHAYKNYKQRRKKAGMINELKKVRLRKKEAAAKRHWMDNDAREGGLFGLQKLKDNSSLSNQVSLKSCIKSEGKYSHKKTIWVWWKRQDE